MRCMNLYILPKIKDSHNASSGALSGWIARLWCYWLSSGKAVSIFNEETSTRGKQQEQVLQTQYSVLCSWRQEKLSSPQMYFGVLHLHLIYPLTRGSLRHHRWLHNQLPPFFPVLHRSLGLAELQARPFPDVHVTLLKPIRGCACHRQLWCLLICFFTDTSVFWQCLTRRKKEYTTCNIMI